MVGPEGGRWSSQVLDYEYPIRIHGREDLGKRWHEEVIKVWAGGTWKRAAERRLEWKGMGRVFSQVQPDNYYD